MFLADYHTHTVYSGDAENTMREMAFAAAEKGISQLCFTDHADECSDWHQLSFTPDFFLSKAGMYEEYEKTRDELAGQIDLRFGAEVASVNHNTEKALEFYSDARFDFIIGSVHNLRGGDDFYFMKYESEEQCAAVTEKYLDEYLEITRFHLCDVLGHIGYPEKYMAAADFKTSVRDYPDRLAEILRSAIQNGIGIEVNTSGLRCCLKKQIPEKSILSLYRSLGGEIITVGSDAHKTSDAGAGIAESYELLRECGFKYVTVFSKHRPEFIKL